MFPAIDRRPAPRSSIAGSSISGGSVFGGPVVDSSFAGSPVVGSPVAASPVAAGPVAARPISPGRPGGALPESRVRTPAHQHRLARAGRVLFALCGAATLLIACPLYSDSCDSRSDCASGFHCDEFSRECEPILDAIGCTRPSQCAAGETCTPELVCRPGSCDYHGCARGYRCGIVDFAHTCVPVDSDMGDEDASVSPPADAGSSDAGFELDASTPPADAAADGGGP